MATQSEADLGTLARLAATVAARRGGDPAQSYTAKLLADPRLAARKVGEEASEVLVAALGETRADLAREAADLVYHLIVLLEARGSSLAEVTAELARREGVSGLAEKAGRESG